MRLRRLLPLTVFPTGPGAAPAVPGLVLDCRGHRCPLPVIELARHIGDVEVGDLVAVVADDPAARADVPAWCRLRGHAYEGERVEPDGAPAFLVRRLV